MEKEIKKEITKKAALIASPATFYCNSKHLASITFKKYTYFPPQY
jgi:hypothetical protein